MAINVQAVSRTALINIYSLKPGQATRVIDEGINKLPKGDIPAVAKTYKALSDAKLEPTADLAKKVADTSNILKDLKVADQATEGEESFKKIEAFMKKYLEAPADERKAIRKTAGLIKLHGVILPADETETPIFKEGSELNGKYRFKITTTEGDATYRPVFVAINSALLILKKIPGAIKAKQGGTTGSGSEISSLLLHPGLAMVAENSVAENSIEIAKDNEFQNSGKYNPIEKKGDVDKATGTEHFFVALYHKGTKRIIALKQVAADANTDEEKKAALKKSF